MARMTRMEIGTLVTVLAEGGEATFEDLGYLLWCPSRAPTPEGAREAGRRRAAPLVAAGALHKRVRGGVAITEKGRIAAALAIAADPILREVFRDDPPQER